MRRATGAAVLRRLATLATPVAVPGTMALVFTALGRRFPPRTAYAAGFAVYWAGWCAGFPLWILGPRGVVRALRAGSPPAPVDVALLAFPVAGAAGAALWPHRHQVDLPVAAVMVGTAAVNAVGEELLWRGTFLDQFPDDVVRGALWPLAGFTAWHLAPQLVYPSPRGRAEFLLGTAVVGAASTTVAWRTRGLGAVLLPHLLTDACGVQAARFRLGRRAGAGHAEPQPGGHHGARRPARPARSAGPRPGRRLGRRTRTGPSSVSDPGPTRDSPGSGADGASEPPRTRVDSGDHERKVHE